MATISGMLGDLSLFFDDVQLIDDHTLDFQMRLDDPFGLAAQDLHDVPSPFAGGIHDRTQPRENRNRSGRIMP